MPHLLGVRRRRVEECLHDLILTNDHLRIVEQRMSVAIHQGLSSSGHKTSSVRCYPTYVCRLPSGTEVGQFLALDLGGTFESFRARHRCRIYRCSTRCWTSSQSSCSSRHRTREHLSSPTSPSFVLCSCSYSWSPRAAAGVRRAVAATPVTTAKTGSMSWLNSSPSPWAIRISERGFHYLIFS